MLPPLELLVNTVCTHSAPTQRRHTLLFRPSETTISNVYSIHIPNSRLASTSCLPDLRLASQRSGPAVEVDASHLRKGGHPRTWRTRNRFWQRLLSCRATRRRVRSPRRTAIWKLSRNRCVRHQFQRSPSDRTQEAAWPATMGILTSADSSNESKLFAATTMKGKVGRP